MTQNDANLACLSDLLEYSENIIFDLVLEKKNRRIRTVVLLQSAEMLLHNAFAIAVLLAQKQTHSSRSILRNLCEIWININFIYLTKDYENLIRLVRTSENEYIYHLGQMNKFSNSNRDLNSILPPDEYIKIFNVRNKELKSLNSYGLPIVGAPNLRSRAQQIDQQCGGHMFERMYFSWYMAGSLPTHSSNVLLSSMRYLDNYVFLNGDEDDLDSIGAVTYLTVLELMDIINKKLELGLKLNKFWALLNTINGVQDLPLEQ
jgi:hypothetical protein